MSEPYFTTGIFKEVGLIRLWMDSEGFEDSGVPQHIAKIANAHIAPLVEKLQLCENLGLTPSDLFQRIGELKEENERLKNEIGLHSGELIGQEHRLGTKYEHEIASLRALLAEARAFIITHAADLTPIPSAIRLQKDIDAALGNDK